MRAWAFLALILITLTHSGCVNNAVPRERMVGVRKVAAVIALDEGMHATCVGTTIFNNEEWDAPQARVETRKCAAEAVSATSHTKVAVVMNTQVADEFASSYNGGSFFALKGPRPSVEMVCRLGQKEQAELVCVVTSVSRMGDFMGQTNVLIPPHGYYHRSIFGLHNDFAYFTARVCVYDARDGASLSDSVAIGAVLLKDFKWASSWAALSAQNQAALRAMVESAARGSIAVKVTELKI